MSKSKIKTSFSYSYLLDVTDKLAQNNINNVFDNLRLFFEHICTCRLMLSEMNDTSNARSAREEIGSLLL